MNKRLIIISLVSVFIVLITCKELKKEMFVSTGAMINILATSAEASGQVIDLGVGVTQYGHCYAKTPNVNITGSKTQLSLFKTGDFTSQLTNLEAGTQYYIKAYISNGNKTVYGKEINFSTVSISAPIVSTTAATSVTNTTAILNGTVNANNFSTAVTFEYGLTASYGSTVNASPSPVTGNTPVGVSASVTGLSAGTLYHFRVKAVSTGGPTNGGDLNFTTSAVLPIAPSNLLADAPNPTTIALTWTDNSNNETGFEIQRKHPTLGTWETVTSVGPDITSYNHSGLSETWPGYQVRAINTVGQSAFSNTALAPAKIRIINNLYSTTPISGNDWYKINAIVSVRFGPTSAAVTASGNTYEKLCPYDNLSESNFLTLAAWINPAYNTVSQYRDFPVNTYGYGVDYYVYIECGWWDYIVIFGPPYYWARTKASVLCQDGTCCCGKWAWTKVTNHTSGYFVITAKELGLPWGSWNDTVKGGNESNIFDAKGTLR